MAAIKRIYRYGLTGLLLASSLSVHAAATTDWTTVTSVAIDNISQVVTVLLAADVSVECGELDLTFMYSDDTVSKPYYATLLTSHLSQLMVQVTYEKGAACTITALEVSRDGAV